MASEKIFRWRGARLTVSELREFLDDLPYVPEETQVNVIIRDAMTVQGCEVVLEVVI